VKPDRAKLVADGFRGAFISLDLTVKVASFECGQILRDLVE
jgi:hypothetical protein